VSSVRWIVKDGEGRIYGPFSTPQVLAEIDRGFFLGGEQVAIYPGGKWTNISKTPEFYDRLLDVLSAEGGEGSKKSSGKAQTSENEKSREGGTKVRPSKKNGQAANDSNSGDQESGSESGDGRKDSRDSAGKSSSTSAGRNGRGGNQGVGQSGRDSSGTKSEVLRPEDRSATLSLVDNSKVSSLDHRSSTDISSAGVIELTDLEALRRSAFVKRIKAPSFALGVAVAIFAGTLGYIFFSETGSGNRIHLLQMRERRETSMAADSAKQKFTKALESFQSDTFAGYQRAQNELVELAEGAYVKAEESRERASTMQLLCLTYRELWQYAYQDSRDSKAIAQVVQEAKRLDPGGIHGAVCEIVQLMVTNRYQEAQNRTENTLEEEGQAPVVFEIRGDIFASMKDPVNAANYFSQARAIYPAWAKTWVQEARAKAEINQAGEAIQLYQAVIKKIPEHMVARIELGTLQFKRMNLADRGFDTVSAALDAGYRIPKTVAARGNLTLAEISAKRGQSSKARDYAQRALKLAPGDKYIKAMVADLGGETSGRTTREDSRELVFQGDQQAKGGDCFAAQAQFKTAFEADPRNGLAALKAAKCLWQLNQVNDSIKWLKKAMEAEPQLTAAYTELADYYAQRYEYYLATQVMRRIQQMQPSNHEVWRGMAQVELRRNNFKGAVSYAQRALKLYDSDLDTLVLMARAQLGLRNFPDAHAYCQRAVEIDFNHVEAQSVMGKIKSGLFGVDVGADYLRKLIAKYQIKQGQPVPYAAVEYRIALGEIYLDDERNPLAEEMLRQAVQLDKNNKRALISLGKSLMAQGQSTGALEALLQAASLDPADPNSIYIAGQVYLDRGQTRDAMSQFERVVRINPKFPRAHIAIGRAALKAGDAQRALKEAQEERVNNPDLADAFVVSAEAFYALGQYGNCGAEYQRAVSKGVQSADIYMRAARCFRLAGSLDSAVSLLRQAQAIESGHAEIYKEQGAIYQTNGLVEEAVKAYEIYLRLSPDAKDRNEVEDRMRRIQNGDMSLRDR
jgi:tetratricopeptide (TPR) repeat protein